jgi:hypothetical protein
MSRGLVCKTLAVFTIILLSLSPVFVQAQSTGASTPVQPTSQNASAATPAARSVPAGPVPARAVTLGTDYSSGKKWFPNPIAPYTTTQIAEPSLTNSQRIASVIQDGKLMLSLEDAITLALEDNLAIAVERYAPWLDQVSLLRDPLRSLGDRHAEPRCLDHASQQSHFCRSHPHRLDGDAHGDSSPRV